MRFPKSFRKGDIKKRIRNDLGEGGYWKKVGGINLTERRSASLRKKGGEKMFEAKIVARNMLTKRNEKGWSQAKAAEACDMSERAYGEIERGNSDPKLSTLSKICKGLEMTLTELITGPVDEAAC